MGKTASFNQQASQFDVAAMNALVLTTIGIGGFAIAFLHAAIPTHWLPFVLAARAQRWTRVKTLAVTGLAGSGHVLFTTALGALVAWGGIALNAKWSRAFPIIAGGALVIVGVFYFIRQFTGGHGHIHLFTSHTHHHQPHDEDHKHHPNDEDENHVHHVDAHPDDVEVVERPWLHRRPDWPVIAGLFALLTFSPCEAFLPIFLTGAKYGWLGFAILSMILALGTVAGMVTFTWLTLLGLQRLHFKALEKYDPLIISGVFFLLGIIIIVFER